MEEFQPKAEISIPWAQDVIDRPAAYIVIKTEEKRNELLTEIEKLEAKLEALSSGLVNPMAREPYLFLDMLEPAEREQMVKRFQEREKESQEAVCRILAAVGLQDQEVVTANYAVFVDDDLAGGYTEEHRVLLGHQAGVYLLSHQVTFSNNVGARRDYLNAHGIKYLIHKDASHPLQVVGKGVFPNLSEISLDATAPTEWSGAKNALRDWVEAIRAKRLLDQLIPYLPTDKLQPIVYENGRVDNSRLFAQNIIELSPGIQIKLSGSYNQVRRGDKTTLELRSVSISLADGETILERYVIDITTLEIRPHPNRSYDSIGNQHMHTKAVELFKLWQDRIEINFP